MRYLVLLLTLGTSAFAGSFGARFEEIKHAAPTELYTFLYALPKGGDLHNHLGGAIRAEWWYAVGTDPARNGSDVFYTRVKFTAPVTTESKLILFQTIRQYTYAKMTAAEQADYVRLDALTPEQKQSWLDSIRLDRTNEGRNEFFEWIWPRIGELFSNQVVIGNVLVETMKAYGAEGLRYLETQQGVNGYLDNTGQPVPTEDAVKFLHERLAQPDAVATGVTVRFQVTGLRFFPDAEQQIERLYQFVDAHRDLWVGINLAGIEENGKGYPLRFLEVFREMRRKYPTLALSIHAGEMDGPDEHIRDTLLLGASRIGHGVNLIKDPDTMLLLQQSRRTLVEINLISNRLLEYTPDLTKNPFSEYLRTGIPVCLNTDDRGMWDSNLTDEYYTAVTTFNQSWDELISMGRNSITFSFAQPEVKARLLADYDNAVDAFESKYAPADSLTKLKEVKPVTYGYAKRTWGFAFGP